MLRKGGGAADVSDGMAKPMPAEPPDADKIAVFMPIRLPDESSSAPPELPARRCKGPAGGSRKGLRVQGGGAPELMAP